VGPLRVVAAEVEIPTTQGDYGLPTGLVPPIGGVAARIRYRRHFAAFLPQNPVVTGFLRKNKPRCRPPTGILTPGFSEIYVKSGRRDSNPRRPAWEALENPRPILPKVSVANSLPEFASVCKYSQKRVGFPVFPGYSKGKRVGKGRE
jgi:hypothetical protein